MTTSPIFFLSLALAFIAFLVGAYLAAILFLVAAAAAAAAL